MSSLRKLQKFLQQEASGGILLFLMAILALLISNSPLHVGYQKLLDQHIVIQVGQWELNGSLLFWINEGLMSLFFLSVGLELKHEFLQGELRKFSQVMLPGVAALGGMIVPALIYVAINQHHAVGLQGWSVPVATDIAFSLGVLSLFGPRVPLGLKLFLMTLAIFDDVGAIIIIGIFHSKALSVFSLIGVVLCVVILWQLNRHKIVRVGPYLFVGFLLWICVLKSGVHATLAGVLLAFMIPVEAQKSKPSTLQQLQTGLHPWVVYFIMPLFALTNAGVAFADYTEHNLIGSVSLGVVAGLFIGKQVGVMLFSWILIVLKQATLPRNTSWLQLYGVSILCGIGFTMSLFLGTLAFYGDNAIFLGEVRLGVLIGSLLSGLFGAAVLVYTFRSKHNKRIVT